jgi:acyl-CoA synthetase (AMP-forming)/AMP-acid ligase II
MGMAERLDIRGNDRLWDPLPLFHMAAILPLLAIISRGGCYLTDAHFDAGDSLDQITRERATMLYPAFPTIMADLVSHADFDPASLGSVRLINNVAPADQLRQNMRLLPDAIHISAYGLTEAGGISCHGDAAESDEVRATTCGRPYAGVRMRVVDPDTGEILPPTERGEMRIRGFSLFSGYYKASDATRAAFDDDGWLRTGDLCSFTEAGQVVYHGRLKDLLKIGGENVSPLELESYLGSLDGVVLAQVVGVPDARLQEVAAAFVQLRPGCELSEADIMEQCRGNIASFKVPRHVRFVDAWPMSATKIQKHVLRSKLLEELGLVD